MIELTSEILKMFAVVGAGCFIAVLWELWKERRR